MVKKILFLICVLFIKPIYAEDFVDAIGAECSRILFHLSAYQYPPRYDTIIKRNMSYNSLQTCLQLYKENGGKIEILNARYSMSQILYKSSYMKCSSKVSEEKEKKECKETALYVMDETLLGKQCGLQTDNDDYYINTLLETIFCKEVGDK